MEKTKILLMKQFDMESTLTIVLCTDENYIIPTYITLFSLLYNYKDSKVLEVYIIVKNKEVYNGFEYLFQFLENQFTLLHIHFISVGTFFDGVSIQSAYISCATMYRLLIPKLIDADKCVYLDSDLIVEDNISSLYNIEIAGYCAAGVRDLVISKKNLTRHSVYLGIPTVDYIQAGVLLLNLEEIRKLGLDKELIQRSKQKNYPYNDQDIINQVLYRRIKILDLRFNSVTLSINRNDNALIEMYGKENVIEARNNPCVYHFAGYRKPWAYKHMYSSQKWWRYVNMQSNRISNDYIEPFLEKQSVSIIDQGKERIESIIKYAGLYPTSKKVANFLKIK